MHTLVITWFLMISIHALREEGDATPKLPRRCKVISIHALREEGDGACRLAVAVGACISIHALREEGDFFFCTGGE